MVKKNIKTARKILSLTDLTRLNLNDNEHDITEFCENMVSVCRGVAPATYPAAICIYPEYVKKVADFLTKTNISSIQVATVINFPAGNDDPEQVMEQTQLAIDWGASEIDLVFPYKSYLSGDKTIASRMVSSCKAICSNEIKLKVIIETGLLETDQNIYDVSRLVIDAGADFIKTSTGKVAVNATISAAETILRAIKEAGSTSCGFKASGGIQKVAEAEKYLLLCEQVMGENWVTPAHFRFGASSLLNDIMLILTKTT
ncbi:MAG: deoxyribose-phosphate aldolase [Endozoicomonadaceae bacterium]|nr:deoxyribose-phosphate aldolase [Endozoicomonadaceae bacterium]